MRETGYYWCLYENEWQLCYYDFESYHWWICGCDEPIFDKNFDEIDEKQIKRE